MLGLYAEESLLCLLLLLLEVVVSTWLGSELELVRLLRLLWMLLRRESKDHRRFMVTVYRREKSGESLMSEATSRGLQRDRGTSEGARGFIYDMQTARAKRRVGGAPGPHTANGDTAQRSADPDDTLRVSQLTNSLLLLIN
jgi:hypothetical protein